MMTPHQDFACMLRGLAQIYEEHPELPRPALGDSERLYVYVPDKETLAAAVRIFGPGKKSSAGTALNYQPDNWPLSLWASKSAMGCEAIEETVVVPEQVIPGRRRKVIPAHTEKRVTYKCAPLLEGKVRDANFAEVEDTAPKLLEPPNEPKDDIPF